MGNAFRLEEVDGSIAILTFDLPEKKVNTLGRAVLAELAGLIARLAGRTDLRGLLFRSGKPGQFIAGADLNELAALAFATREQVAEAIAFGHQLFDRIARLPFPTVALVDGNCMGGGTELILAMDDRIVTRSPATKIALPEVKLGLLPAWGGTQRLPRRIGLHHAIEMICKGEPISAERAASLGLAFDAVPADRLVEEGVRLVEYHQQSGDWLDRRERERGPLGLGADQLRFAVAVAGGAIKAKTGGRYPAPLAALGAIRDGCNVPLSAGLEAEREAAMGLVGSSTSANLIAVFFMKNRLERDPGVAVAGVSPRTVRRVGVAGAGLMGAGIAAATARSGLPTAMIDMDEARLAAGLRRAGEVVVGRIKIGRATPEDLIGMLGCLNTSTSTRTFADCDVVIEAINEDEAAKAALFRTIGGDLRDDAILASNTSTISITRLAASAPAPERFVGMHFFHPVDRMELVEIIRGDRTNDETVATVVALAKRLRKMPIVVRDGPGFLVNRVLFPYLIEAILMAQEGASMDAVDAAAERFGMPMGPIALADLVGLDTAAGAGAVLLAAFPDRSVPTPILRDLVAAGRLGKKSGAGFRSYAKKGKAEADPTVLALLERHRTGDRPPTDEEITDRLFLPMLLEATRVLEEGIVGEPADVDMGLILGTGFPPFRGGLLRWADGEGAGAILDRLERYRSLGERFAPTALLTRLASRGETFYPGPRVAAPVRGA
ncbi:MAG: 3-hydroxyacyl-CoA dehydrogenase NAD-binding domain-containing protein [Paludisphaera borealis]|uniref:3-hydroxyacyl-CoA dehydrogenase NAD-binding domain-containing protein n=1 Tax=Paludisphaera borealis TaxID=1387353 RepID=UPI00283C4857|nr:3-hydroxyacyl-CoA dehydrogenase NAD-binding domain-containing protein [Paludisphaera borealis]MDR3618257.1 3-hydroxyacyl-CoA dehydrogenase NAD-binding domain-containing protein [Paludisphaera borealis]